jgi:L-fuconolactonase
VLQSFGAQRVMWGSDWPVCTLAASYTEWVQLALQLTAHLSESDRQAVWHENAVRVYRLEE